MKICNNCRKTFPDNSTFCDNCGQKLAPIQVDNTFGYDIIPVPQSNTVQKTGKTSYGWILFGLVCPPIAGFFVAFHFRKTNKSIFLKILISSAINLLISFLIIVIEVSSGFGSSRNSNRVSSTSTLTTTTQITETQISESKIIACAEQAVCNILRDPSSAIFNSAEIIDEDDYGRYLIKLDVTATNGFGGRNRTQYFVVLQNVIPGDTYQFNYNQYFGVTELAYNGSDNEIASMKELNDWNEPK